MSHKRPTFILMYLQRNVDSGQLAQSAHVDQFRNVCMLKNSLLHASDGYRTKWII